MTGVQYQQVKNEEYTLVKFRDGVRVITASGLSFYDIVKELIENRAEFVTLVINEKDLPQTVYGGRIETNSRDIKDYEKYFKMQKKLF